LREAQPSFPNIAIVTMKRTSTSRDALPPANLHFAGLKASLALIALLVGSHAGCYNGSELISRARSAALNSRLAEVDLGVFHTSLPRDSKTGSITELGLHVFGTVPHYRVAAIERQLKTDEYRLRHETLVAVRAATREELAEPDLNRLRKRIERIVNSILEEAPVETIGFYEVTIR
jgi:hypothetical protein